MLSVFRRGLSVPKHLAVCNKRFDVYSNGLSTPLPIFQIRNLSSREVLFGGDMHIPLPKLPPMPEPPTVGLSIEELAASGQSVLAELGLFSWWKPSSWLRLVYENFHLYTDLPWWGTIVCGTIILRLLLIAVPIMSQRLVAKQSQYKTELDEFRDRINKANSEGDTNLVQEIFMEQRKFYKAKGIKFGAQFVVMVINGSVFFTQFSAINKMAKASYPGFSTEGPLWFTDLTACDPYYALPIISATTLALVFRVGIESGQSMDQMGAAMRYGLTFGIPIMALVCSSQFPTAVCLYWVTSNFVSLFYAGFFRQKNVRKFFNIPMVVKHEKKPEDISQFFKKFNAKRNAPPSITSLKKKDNEQFKKAGREKPVLKVD